MVITTTNRLTVPSMEKQSSCQKEHILLEKVDWNAFVGWPSSEMGPI